MTIKYEYCDSAVSDYLNTTASLQRAQSFTPLISHEINSVRLYICKWGTPGNVTVGIKNTDISGKPSGGYLTSTTFDGSLLADVEAWYQVDFSTVATLTAGTKYAIVLSSTGGGSTWDITITGGTYARGEALNSSDSGSTWTAGNYDFLFEEYGNPVPSGFDIDVGSNAIVRFGSSSATYTFIDLANPANNNGVLNSVELYFASDATGVKVGTFYGIAPNFTCRDFETIGNVTAGSKQTFDGLSIDVKTGDYIGVYYATGGIWTSLTGGSGVYEYNADYFDYASHTYTLLANYAMSAFGIGAPSGLAYNTRIAFSDTPFTESPTWTDISDDLMDFKIRRGRQYELNRMEAGTAEVTLKNIDGDYWPNNTSSPYYGYIQPWKKINIRARYNYNIYDLYTGYVESWNPDFILRPIKAPIMQLVCADGIKSVSQLLLNNSTGYSVEASGTRIGNVLDTLGWPSTSRSLDTGQSNVQATGVLTNTNAMSHSFTVQDTELGIMFVSPSGSMVYQDRHARLKSPYTTSQATFGDSAGELGYTEILLAHEDLRIYNDIRITRLTGTEQVATSTTSIDAYGKRGLQKPSLLMTSDIDALAQAQYLLNRYQQPAMRVKQIKIKSNSDPSNLYPKTLGYDISTRITIKLAQASLNKDYHIEGIRHTWDVKNAEGLQTIWMLTDAANQGAWVLDSSTDSILGTTTIPAY